MLGGSAPAGLSFLSKAARHSSGFTKSFEDETNPVASLCESCRQTTPTPPHPLYPPAGPPLSLPVQMGEDRQEVRLQFELLSIWGLVSIECGDSKKKKKKKNINLKELGPPGHLVERAAEMTDRERTDADIRIRQIIMGKPAMLRGNKGKLCKIYLMRVVSVSFK